VIRPYKVTQGHPLLCHQRSTYDFLLALNHSITERWLNSNLTTIFNCSWDVTPSLHIRTPPLFQMELEKDETTGSSWTCFGVMTTRTHIGLSTIKFKSALTCTVWLQCMPVPYRQTDRKTDGRTSWQYRDDSF